MSKKVLFIASNYGLWGEELQAPWDACRKAGIQTQLATYKGMTPLPLQVSVQAGFIDPVQNVVMTPKDIADRINHILDGQEWANPIKTANANMAEYDAIVLVGGPGAGFDMAGSTKVHSLLQEASNSGKLICAICSAVAAVAYARHPKHGRSLLFKKRAAAHPRSWDFEFDLPYQLTRSTPENNGSTIVTPGFIVPVQPIAEDACGNPELISAVPNASRESPVVIWDKPILTAQSVESSVAFGQKIVELLQTEYR